MRSRHLYQALLLSIGMTACGDGGGGSGDVTAPTATVTTSPRAVLGGGTVTATVTFSEDVTGFTASDMAVTGGAAGAFTQVNAHTYTLAITAGGAGTTTLDIDIAADAGRDAAGNPSAAASGQAAVAFAPWASSTGTDVHGVWAELSVTGIGETAVQRFRLIAPGAFAMGSPADEPDRNNNGSIETESLHLVTLTMPYWIADSECTQRMWKAVMNTTPSWHQPPLIAAENLDLPVELVSYPSIQSFLGALNLIKVDLAARLPSESEWEYAARAGTSTPFSLEPVTTDTVNCHPTAHDPYIATGTYRTMTMPVKSLPPNPWGLYDVHGNVWEWCSDWWQDDWGTASATDPAGPASGTYGVKRGGSWVDDGRNCRSACRGWDVRSNAMSNLGFRIVVPGQPSGPG